MTVFICLKWNAQEEKKVEQYPLAKDQQNMYHLLIESHLSPFCSPPFFFLSPVGLENW